MAEAAASQQSRSKLLETIVEAGKRAFNPSNDNSIQEKGRIEYDDIINKTETWVLLPNLNALIKPNVLPEWLRSPFVETLTLLPLREGGVRATMEFVFSVHPSNTGRAPDTNQPQKEGASITHEALAIATKLLSSVPASMTPESWFGGISAQLFHLMDGKDGPDLSKAAAQIVGFGVLGKKVYGAPGSPGWQVFVQPLIESINPSTRTTRMVGDGDDEEILDLTKGQVLVKSEALGRSVRLLSVLVFSNSSPGLCSRVLKPVLPQLWALASLSTDDGAADAPSKAARNLLQAYLRLSGNIETASILIRNLLCGGSLPASEQPWQYRKTSQGFEIVSQSFGPDMSTSEIQWADLQSRAEILAELLVDSCSPENVSSIFIELFQRWIKTAGTPNDIISSTDNQDEGPQAAMETLFDVTVLQKLLEKSPEKLINQFDQLLELICQVLSVDDNSRLADDLVGVTLSLLNLVITAPTFSKSDINQTELNVIEQSLERLGGEARPQISQTASNLSLLLRYKDELNQQEEATSHPSQRQVEDRRTYDLAMNYITGVDSPPPVISEGLNLLSGLIQGGSSILDITAVNVLLSNLLENGEDYVNLRVVKLFTQMANKHPRSTVKELLDHFLDPQEKLSTDIRLRFGEALVQVIERLGETFAGEVALQVTETLLSIAGRRGYRPKAMRKQTREERKQRIKKEEDGVDEQDDEDERTADEKARDDVLAQILQGWESKRGSEDIRMRASALSILGTALETNIRGVGSFLVSTTVDLCVSVLALEPEMEKAILRRAAIMVVLGFIRALETARESGVSLGFGLQEESRSDISRTLQYVAGTDNDGLVQQHARDVIESLENWHMASLVPSQVDYETPRVGRLEGLRVNVDTTGLGAPSGKPRPRIEEIE
ncbi:unnamed protein product [Clonostachys rosea]|uniref:RNA polymerase II assembly factor Rtp1 C-terminal domain-containing protein n=1 Tax=Bionectria ochroleuca TaxID=29856 RepID=A0ABY6TVY2_BIOOC|nr:unnamed protein product [Clonostachys rosea]